MGNRKSGNPACYSITQAVPFILAATMVAGLTLPSAAETATGRQITAIQAASQNKTSNRKPVKELMSMIKKPTSPKELLKNLKFAIENELLMQDDFYTDENLKKLFGGNRVVWFNEPNFLKVKLYDFKGVFANAEEYKRRSLDIYKRRFNSKGELSNNGKIHVKIGLPTFNDSRFNPETIKKVFGPKMLVEDAYERHTIQNSKTSDSSVPPHDVLLSPATHPLGNKKMVYVFDTPLNKARIAITLEANGVVNKCNSFQEEK